MAKYVLILYYSRYGATQAMAEAIAEGVRETGVEVRIRTVPPVSPTTDATDPSVPSDGPPYVLLEDIEHCSAIALGSPTRFGNMAAPLKYFLDTTSGLWMSGALVNKPFCVFTSTSSLHGGQESTLLSMALPMLHHGAVWVGLPYTEKALTETQSGGSPYGATHWAHPRGVGLREEEGTICRIQGKRLAAMAQRLST